MLHMFQWLYTYAVRVCSKCFICFRRMLQVFYLDVAFVANVSEACCKRLFKLFDLFLDVCCKYFDLDVA